MSNKYPGGFVSLGGQIPSYSVVFDGTGDYLSVADNTALDMEASDFTMECWFKPNTSASVAGQTIFGKRANAGTIGGTLLGFWGTDLKPAMYATVNGSTWGVSNVTSSVALSVGVWSHLAFTRSGSTWTIWVNGFATATATLAGTVPNNTSAFTIGATSADGSDTICASNISNARIVKGTALYTTSFTPPTGPLQNITNTSLLTCQSATLIDNSSNGFTVTAAGNAAVSSVQPPFTSYNPNNLDPALGAATPGVWTLSQALAAEVTRSWPMYDPYYKNVVLNLHGEGTNGAQNNTFLDSSTNNFTITRNGNTTQGSFSPYGPSWSNYFDGTGDYLTTASSTALALSTGDFTVEAWIYLNGTQVQFASVVNGLNYWYLSFDTGNKIFFSDSSTVYVDSGTYVLSSNVWTHVAVTRSGTSLKLFLNGVQVGSATNSTSFGTTAIQSYVGTNNVGTYFNGYISNIRVVKGTAVYTANFTPSTTPLTAIANTSLLTCQSNRFVDNSASPLAITAYGDTKVQRFQPFLFNTSYTPSTIGGSGYFDGTGDYLTIPYNASLEMGSSDFTIDFWVYLTSSAATQVPVSQWETSGNKRSYNINISTTGVLTLTTSSTGAGTGNTNAATAAGAINFNSWNHVRISKSGTSAYVGANGVITTGSAVSTLYSPGNNITMIGGYISTAPALLVTGYICDVRIIKGTALDTGSTYTIPTAPLTAVTNTSLLTNFTNGAIYDNAMMNDLETVGNAQISTSVKKYGTGSMYFDGTGDYLQFPVSQNFNFGYGDFTIEGWINLTSVAAVYQTIFMTGYTVQIYEYGGTIYSYFNDSDNSTSYIINGLAGPANSISANTWAHFAIVRNGSTFTCYINGVAGTPLSSSGNVLLSATAPTVGINIVSTAYPLTGYIDDLRITKGVARYVANFTPPTSQLQDQ